MNHFLAVALLSMGCVFTGLAQNELKFEISKLLPALSIQENELSEVSTLTDLDKRYPSSWVKEYKSVEISAFKNGTKTKAFGKSDVLNDAQKELIRSADLSRGIEVRVMYLPENSLENNSVKQHDFKVSVMPDKNAFYGEGTEKMIQFFRNNCMANVGSGSFTGYDLTAIKFTVTEQGHVANVEVALPSEDEKIVEMLVAAISKMPKWTPAKYSNGLKVAQDFVLTIGNMENCMATLLNIRPIE